MAACPYRRGASVGQVHIAGRDADHKTPRRRRLEPPETRPIHCLFIKGLERNVGQWQQSGKPADRCYRFVLRWPAMRMKVSVQTVNCVTVAARVAISRQGLFLASTASRIDCCFLFQVLPASCCIGRKEIASAANIFHHCPGIGHFRIDAICVAVIWSPSLSSLRSAILPENHSSRMCQIRGSFRILMKKFASASPDSGGGFITIGMKIRRFTTKIARTVSSSWIGHFEFLYDGIDLRD